MVKKTEKSWTVPYKDGKPFWGWSKETEERPADTEFEATLKFKNIKHYSTSGIQFIFTDSDGSEYEMLKSDFEDAVPYMINGILKGRFGFAKKGYAIGIVFKP